MNENETTPEVDETSKNALTPVGVVVLGFASIGAFRVAKLAKAKVSEIRRNRKVVAKLHAVDTPAQEA